MNPLRLAEPDPDQRRLDCRRVTACLNVAIAHEWEGFACGEGCYVRPTPEERSQDLEAVAALWTSAHWRQGGFRRTADDGLGNGRFELGLLKHPPRSKRRKAELRLDDLADPGGER